MLYACAKLARKYPNAAVFMGGAVVLMLAISTDTLIESFWARERLMAAEIIPDDTWVTQMVQIAASHPGQIAVKIGYGIGIVVMAVGMFWTPRPG